MTELGGRMISCKLLREGDKRNFATMSIAYCQLMLSVARDQLKR